MRRLLDDQDRETALGTIGSSLIAMALLLGSGRAEEQHRTKDDDPQP